MNYGLNSKSLIILSAWAIFNVAGLPQVPPVTELDHVQLAREFLRSLYPELSARGYTMSLATSAPYDEDTNALSQFALFVGVGDKDRIIGYSGGSIALPDPNGGASRPPKGYHPGPMHPEQFLTGGFRFDGDRLEVFTAAGPAVGNREAGNSFFETVHTHPEWTIAQITAASARQGPTMGLTTKKSSSSISPLKTWSVFWEGWRSSRLTVRL